MAKRNWRKGPLADEVDSFLSESGPRTLPGLPLHSRAVYSWQRWLQLAESPSATAFSSNLSIAQFNSHRMLLELWQGRPADQQLMKDILEFYQQIADDGEQEDGPKAGDQDYRLPLMNTSSAFHSSIFELFKWEFFVYTDDEDGAKLSSIILHDVRQEAAIYMSCSRLSRQCFEPYLANDHRYDQHTSMGSSSMQLGHERLRSSWIRGSICAGPSLEPCAWLNGGHKVPGLPYFLWDRLEGKTIPVQELKDRPQYIAISHTWGRWKIDGPPVSVPGTPWQIPPNTRFNVMDLANILQLIKFPHRYIWLDLLCIPQDHSELAKREISRQATIFREASSTIMWLNDVTGWKHLSAAIETMCLIFNRDNGFLAIEPEEKSLQEEETLDSPIELLNPRVDQGTGFDLNPWFTSLWTLQEICLRPDMLICDANWQFLTVGTDVPLAFDELVALSATNNKAIKEESEDPGLQKPRSIAELDSLLARTGLANLLKMSRPTILILGNQRQCLERRAEAIMAVLDATEWYSTSSEDSAEKDLILNLYPSAFVNEILVKLGPATFFSSESMEPYFIKSLERLMSVGEISLVGSMLPFGEGFPKFFNEIKSDPNLSPVKSVETWVVDQMGYVQVKEALIVSSSKDLAAVDTSSSFIFGPVIDASNDSLVMPQENMNLHSWVRDYLPPFPNYAVAMYTSPAGSLGILLKEIVPGVLVKIGSYWEQTSRNPPESEVVDWKVI